MHCLGCFGLVLAVVSVGCWGCVGCYFGCLSGCWGIGAEVECAGLAPVVVCTGVVLQVLLPLGEHDISVL